jgi:hypothetical protein
MSHLRVLEIHISLALSYSATMSDLAIKLSFLMRSLCASLTSPATLEHLKLNISFDADDTVKTLITHTAQWTFRAMAYQRLWVQGGRPRKHSKNPQNFGKIM